MHKPTCSTEGSDYSLQKILFFSKLVSFFLCGVVKKSTLKNKI